MSTYMDIVSKPRGLSDGEARKIHGGAYGTW